MYKFTSVLPPSLLAACGKTAATKQTDLQSGPCLCAATSPSLPPRGAEVCQEADPSHNEGAVDFIQGHMGDACGEMAPPAPPLYMLLSKGVAADPTGTLLPFIKAIAMKIVCNFWSG